jgi:hypothetical protein
LSAQSTDAIQELLFFFDHMRHFFTLHNTNGGI